MAVKSNYFGYIFSLQYTFLKLMTLHKIKVYELKTGSELDTTRIDKEAIL